MENNNYQCLSTIEKFEKILEREDNRDKFYKILYKLCGICITKGIRMIIENPFSTLHFLHNNFLKEPTIIDHNRQRRGDYFVKPTGYWYFNCEPTSGKSIQKPKETKTIWGDAKGGIRAGICSEERSMISPDYARNFICDFILGKVQHDVGEPQLDFGDIV